MKKSQEILGLPVFSILDGRKLGQVKDLVINPEEAKVEFILVSNGSWYVGARVLPFKAVMGVGEHAVTTESESHLTAINETSTANSLLQRNIEVKGNRVLTNKGNLIGVVSEYEIDEHTGKMVRLEYRTALDESKIEIVDAENVLTYGADVIVIKEKAGTAQPPTSPAPISESIKEGTGSPSSDGTNLFKERQKQFLLGKRVIQDIKDANGTVIIPEGTVVTEEICDLAESKGKFVELSQCAK